MNEVLRTPEHRWPKRAFFKHLVWTAARSCALSGLYGWTLGDHWLRIERCAMPLRNLGAGFRGATIAHISDLHCSPIVREKYLRQCVEAVNRLDVDFVAITGDFIIGPRHYARRVAGVLRGLTPKVATIACLGNHDYGLFHPNGLGGIRGLSDYTAHQLGLADVFVMLNESRTFRRNGAKLQFVGVEDYWSRRYDPHLAFEIAHREVPTVALCHNPRAAEQVAKCGAEWVLAGHTHGADPVNRLHRFIWRPGRENFSAGSYRLPDGGNLYVNRGISYGRRLNLNARPEITLFTLKAAEAEDLQ